MIEPTEFIALSNKWWLRAERCRTNALQEPLKREAHLARATSYHKCAMELHELWRKMAGFPDPNTQE